MTWTLIIIVLVLGVTLLTLEIVALPGLISGIFGLGLMAFGIWQSYLLGGNSIGTYILIGCIATCAILLAVFMKSKTWNKFSLNEESDSKVNQIAPHTIEVGARGTTIARLAPTGKALIDGKMVEVHSVNTYIEPNTEIEVVAIDGYRIDVREVGDYRF